MLKLITQFLIFLGLYLAPIAEHALVIFALMSIDLITGLWASAYLGIAITSNRLKRTVTKFLIYGFALIVSLLVSQTYGMPWAIMGISFFIATVEIKSISENMLLINPEFNLFKILKQSLSSEKSSVLEENKKEKLRKQDEKHHKEQ